MRPIRRILAPTDFSEDAERAWPYVTKLARDFGAELHLLHVASPPPQLHTEEFVYERRDLAEKRRAEAQAFLERLVESAEELGVISQWHLRTGFAPDEILGYARQDAIDLIVMASHGRTGLAHALLGSVAETVVRRAPCPVFIVRHPAAERRPVMLQRILVSLDGSALAEAVLPHVVELGKPYRATILLLRVAEARAFAGMDPVEAQVRTIAVGEAYLAEVERSLAASGLPVECAVRYGAAADEIADHARGRAADLIAMSTHGRTGLRRAALGSVAETVLRTSRIPVFLLPMTALAKVGAVQGPERAGRKVV